MTLVSNSFIERFVGHFGSRLRFPQLFTAVAILFVLDLPIPDFIPFVDEILLGLLTLLLGSLRTPDTSVDLEGKPPIKDITPKEG